MDPETDVGGRARRNGGRRGLLVLVVGIAVLAAIVWGVALVGVDLRGAHDEARETPQGEYRQRGDEPAAAERTRAPEAFEELVHTVAGQVGDIRGLEVEEPIEARYLDADELAATVAEVAARNRDPEELETRRRILVALRLLPADLDLEATLDELLAEQVAGLYSPEDRVLYIRSDEPDDLTAGEEVTLAHEVLHALQDQAFGLQRFVELPDEDPDAGLAAQSLIEGDAVLTQELWSFRHQSEEDRAARLDELAELDTDALEQAPRYLRESLVFPYQEGLTFVQSLHESGGFETIDDAFADPPTASAQIIDPQRYLDGEEPVHVDVSGSPGTDWTPLGDHTVGAFDLRSLVREVDPDRASEVAAGWAGGRLGSWERDDDVALGVGLTFRTESEAADACASLVQWYAVVADGTETADPGVYEGNLDWAAVRCVGAEVRVGIAPEAEIAARLSGQ